MKEALQEARRMTYHHAMGPRKGVLRDESVTQPPLRRSPPQHRLRNSRSAGWVNSPLSSSGYVSGENLGDIRDLKASVLILVLVDV